MTRTSLKKGPTPIQDILAVLKRRLGEESSRHEQITSFWEELLGEKRGLHAKVYSCENGIATIVVDNSSLLHALSLEKEILLAKIQKKFGKTVKEIRLQAGGLAF